MSSARPTYSAQRPRRARRQRPEEILQRHCVDILLRGCPAPPEGPAWTAINPVPAKSKAAAGISKAMGLRAGWPDLELLFRGRVVYVEFKDAKNGRVSQDQRDRHAEILAAGGTIHIVTTAAGFLDVLRAEGIPCRVREVFGGTA